MEHGIKNGTTNIHVSRTKLNKNTLLAFGLEGFVLRFVILLQPKQGLLHPKYNACHLLA